MDINKVGSMHATRSRRTASRPTRTRSVKREKGTDLMTSESIGLFLDIFACFSLSTGQEGRGRELGTLKSA